MRKAQQATVTAAEYRRLAALERSNNSSAASGKLPRRTAASNYIRVGRGFREDIPGIWFRSTYEANFARYLRWLEERGEIAVWSYEPEEFWFDAIRRGTRSYKPDFRVQNADGTTVYYECKGWMDARSKTKLRRMAKYYPAVRIVVIGRQEHAELARKLGKAIPGWESHT